MPVAPASPRLWDLVIRGGRVVDGAGGPACHADVAVRRGRIAAVGRVVGAGRHEIDAAGRIVAPGFIDVHSHAENVLALPLAENYLRMGVTTVVAGNCGESEADIGRFLRLVDRLRPGVNVASLLGHGTVRATAMAGERSDRPTAAELDAMRAGVARAMRQGALGLSSGLIYMPGCWAEPGELTALAAEAARAGGLYTTHMRCESVMVLSALDETFAIARGAGIRAHVSHIKVSGRSMWGQAPRVLEAIEAARAAGLDITQDQYLYTASATELGALLPAGAREGGEPALRRRLADPAQRAAIVDEMDANRANRGEADYAYVALAACESHPALAGLRLPQAARLRLGDDTLERQIELIFEIELAGGASAVFHGMCEEDLQTFLRHPNTAIGADSGVRELGRDVPHPRGYGNNARLLSRYVRELGLLRLEEAVRRMTSLPARIFGLQDRGELREGAAADIVVFDPAAVNDRATYEDPHNYAEGFCHVIVNGIQTIRDGRICEQRGGRALRLKAVQP